jgi:hypothetical protein
LPEQRVGVLQTIADPIVTGFLKRRLARCPRHVKVTLDDRLLFAASLVGAALLVAIITKPNLAVVASLPVKVQNLREVQSAEPHATATAPIIPRVNEMLQTQIEGCRKRPRPRQSLLFRLFTLLILLRGRGKTLTRRGVRHLLPVGLACI